MRNALVLLRDHLERPVKPLTPPASSHLWAAWQGIGGLEDRVRELCGDELAGELLALWAIARFGDRLGGHDAVLDDLVDEQLHPLFGDWLLEDVARFAFALGAGWDQSRPVDPRAAKEGTDLHGGKAVAPPT